jgi:hypothetical protein
MPCCNIALPQFFAAAMHVAAEGNQYVQEKPIARGRLSKMPTYFASLNGQARLLLTTLNICGPVKWYSWGVETTLQYHCSLN